LWIEGAGDPLWRSPTRPLVLAVNDGHAADRWRQPFRHPECGTMTLEDLAAICAGHELHHLAQLRQIP